MRRTARVARIALPMLLVAATATACQEGDDKPTAAPAVQAAMTVDARESASLPVRRYSSARRDGDTYIARVTGSEKRSGVRLGGVGFLGGGSQNGTRYVGAGFGRPWTEQVHGTTTVAFRHRGGNVGIQVWSRGGRWRAKVNGRLAQAAPRTAGTDYAFHTLGLRLPRSRATRRIEFELAGGAWFAGVRAAPVDSVVPTAKPAARSVYWLGDSFSAGTGGRYPGFSDLVHRVSARLKLGDTTVDAFGGTGYLARNSPAKFPNYLDRAERNVRSGRAQPDLIVAAGSINDVGRSRGQVRAQATTLFAYLRKAAPKAKIVAVPFAPAYPIAGPFKQLELGVEDAARASGGRVAFLDLPAALTRRARGDLARLQALQRRDGHPSPRGHVVYGDVIARFIEDRRLLRRR